MRITTGAPIFLCALLSFWCGSGRLAGEAHAASSTTAYPTKPLRWIVATSPSGGTDFVARMYSHKVTELMGQSVVIDNRPGANGMIGMELGARAAPDGYSAVVISVGHLIAASLSRNAGFSPVKDFSPVALLATTRSIMAIHPSLNVRTIQEFITLARNQPGKINYASGGIGGVQHLSTELLKREAKIDLVHVPYKGSGPALIDLLAGHVQIGLLSFPSTLQYIKAGRLRALAVTGKQRSLALPDVPTFAESGLPGVAVDIWYGMLAPVRTPHIIVDKLAHTIATVARMPDIREKLSAQGADPAVRTPAEFGVFLQSESEKWGKVASDVGIHIE